MPSERRGRRIDSLPEWAKRFAEEYGAKDLDDRNDVFFGPLIDRRSGLRKDDLIKLLIDARALRAEEDPWVRGMLLATSRNAVEMLDENGDCLLYTSPSPRDGLLSRMPSSA